MKIAILKYSTPNLGDDIQSFALERLLPNVDLRIDRDNLLPARSFAQDVKFILNGWFRSGCHRGWPLQTQANVLHIGMFACDQDIIPKNSVHAIGCRDRWTYNLCVQNGIKAWLSWCATLTLDLPISNDRKQVVFVDVPEKTLSQIPGHIVQSAVKVTHDTKKDAKNRNDEIRKRLDLYSESKLVVTGRLHVCLPCLAMGIPVVLIPRPINPGRYDGYVDLAWNINNVPWDFPYPKTPPEFIRGMSCSFREMVRSFIDN